MSGYDITCDPGDLYTRKCYVNVHSPSGCLASDPACTITQQEIISYTGGGDPISKAPSANKWQAWVPTLTTLNQDGVAYQPYGDAGLPFTATGIAGYSETPFTDDGSDSSDSTDSQVMSDSVSGGSAASKKGIPTWVGVIGAVGAIAGSVFGYKKWKSQKGTSVRSAEGEQSHPFGVDAELGKDSCCCGAIAAAPCACMIKGVMDCSATCPCSLEKQEFFDELAEQHENADTYDEDTIELAYQTWLYSKKEAEEFDAEEKNCLYQFNEPDDEDAEWLRVSEHFPFCRKPTCEFCKDEPWEYRWNNGDYVLCCCSEPTRDDDFCPEGGYNNSGDECRYGCGHEDCAAYMKAKYEGEIWKDPSIKWEDYKGKEKDQFEAPYAGAGALMGITQNTDLSDFTPEELATSSAIHGDFNQASLNYSGHQNIEVRSAEDDKIVAYCINCGEGYDQSDWNDIQKGCALLKQPTTCWCGNDNLGNEGEETIKTPCCSEVVHEHSVEMCEDCNKCLVIRLGSGYEDGCCKCICIEVPSCGNIRNECVC